MRAAGVFAAQLANLAGTGIPHMFWTNNDYSLCPTLRIVMRCLLSYCMCGSYYVRGRNKCLQENFVTESTNNSEQIFWNPETCHVATYASLHLWSRPKDEKPAKPENVSVPGC